MAIGARSREVLSARSGPGMLGWRGNRRKSGVRVEVRQPARMLIEPRIMRRGEIDVEEEGPSAGAGPQEAHGLLTDRVGEMTWLRGGVTILPNRCVDVGAPAPSMGIPGAITGRGMPGISQVPFADHGAVIAVLGDQLGDRELTGEVG